MTDTTVTITSCGRFDLLKRTLDSFLANNTYPIHEILISEDSESLFMKNKILSEYGDKVKLIFNEKNQGLLKSLDNLFSSVKTKYIFHIEDDWEFTSNNTNFIQESKDILESRPDLHQVWLRNDIPQEWVEEEWLENNCFDFGNSPAPIQHQHYKLIKLMHLDNWCGYSFNPGLRRKSDYDLMFPNGLQEFQVKDLPVVHSEYACAQHSNKFNYRAAILSNPCCKHIGNERTTETKNEYLIITSQEKMINGIIYKTAYIKK